VERNKPKPKPKIIRSIQAFRAIACILIVLFHSSGIFDKYFERPLISEIFKFGNFRVPFFFILSGFIMHHIHQKDFGKPDKFIPYFKKRITRIYPLYWMITLSVLPVFFLFPNFGTERHKDIIVIIKSLLLIPQDNYPILGVAWTLTFEISFYCALSLLILNLRIGRFLIQTWLISCILVKLFSLNLIFPYTFIFSEYNIFFGIGISISISKVIYTKFYSHIEAFFTKRKLLLYIGNASYSIYLVHYPILSITAKIMTTLKIDNYISNSLIFILISLIGVFSGLVTYEVIEQRLSRWLR
jgi:peptidoglycan/LPS O-acetylase OafA/YrhL